MIAPYTTAETVYSKDDLFLLLMADEVERRSNRRRNAVCYQHALSLGSDDGERTYNVLYKLIIIVRFACVV